MSDDYAENAKKSDRNFWGGAVFLVLVAAFAPERYSILVFLCAIWATVFEVSDRFRVQYYFHKRNAEALEKLLQK